MHSNRYTFLYAIGISIVTAVILVLTSVMLKPKQDFNLALDTKSNILKSVKVESAIPKEIERMYGEQVEELVINSEGEKIEGVKPSQIVLKNELAKPLADRKLPLYIFTEKDNSKNYVIPLYGVGLWGPIWGFLALDSDLNTVKGAFFDHKGETPGLGAEIAEKSFQDQFIGKKIKDGSNNFISVNVVKKSAKVDFGDEYRVDAISGGTITSEGTDKMLKKCVEPYLVYFNKIKN
ncbi:NADH:ubiquinone reductase (Na(+)-transporting) subunit C [Lacihabitans lacunae]|jgi:Na+-transporting NADH:ubiquinone oxidoreductase subunit C|uniref:Na(+)-translocating NADH-quinone reductase subunit C n=1 Tax=Lacihabitans lacunae TaxID=1028214 RepID=A0ABV7Z3D6_9BACT